jgi:hypothetical protein
VTGEVCDRCRRTVTTWRYVGADGPERRPMCDRCVITYYECLAAVEVIERHANSVHAGGIIARLREVAESAT